MARLDRGAEKGGFQNCLAKQVFKVDYRWLQLWHVTLVSPPTFGFIASYQKDHGPSTRIRIFFQNWDFSFQKYLNTREQGLNKMYWTIVPEPL